MATPEEQGEVLYPKLDVGRIRRVGDVDRMLADASDELMRLLLVGKLFGLSTPETDRQLAQVADNIAKTNANMEAARKIHP